jgi:protein TonB
MKIRHGILFAALALSGCANSPPFLQGIGARIGDIAGIFRGPSAPATTPVATGPASGDRDTRSAAASLDAYKIDLAQHIVRRNQAGVSAGRPQALLRSVVVVKYAVDQNGNLVRSEIMRSNRDFATEKIAMSSLHNSTPFPRPVPHLLRHGPVEVIESFLFNTDGRFQLRTIAEPQMDQ